MNMYRNKLMFAAIFVAFAVSVASVVMAQQIRPQAIFGLKCVTITQNSTGGVAYVGAKGDTENCYKPGSTVELIAYADKGYIAVGFGSSSTKGYVGPCKPTNNGCVAEFKMPDINLIETPGFRYG